MEQGDLDSEESKTEMSNPKIILKRNSLENGPKTEQDEEIDDENGITNVLHISNLTRPFTLNQLKELLSKHGKIVDEHFWINSVKSHCYVEYESKSHAKLAKQHLNNLVWPSSNPKQLVCRYCTLDELLFNMNGGQGAFVPAVNNNNNKHKDVDNNKENKELNKDQKEQKEKESKKAEKIREWDLPKLRQRSRSKERRRVEEVEKEPKKKENKNEQEEIPKTLDDLFRKTTTTPFIYWLPLTEEQYVERQKELDRRQVEREKRAEERRLREEAEKAQREKERQERLEKEEKERKERELERQKQEKPTETKEPGEVVTETKKDESVDVKKRKEEDEKRDEKRDDKRDDKRDEMMKAVGRYDGRGEDQQWLKMMTKRMRDDEKDKRQMRER